MGLRRSGSGHCRIGEPPHPAARGLANEGELGRAAERLHGITLLRLWTDGRPVWEIAQRTNEALDGRELFSDAPQDETWLRLLFGAAGLEPTFILRKTDARVLIPNAPLTAAWIRRARALAAEMAPRRHRVEADARHLVVLWNITAYALAP